ncbi:MAG: holo-ACP synthase [candidate division Zixibacteria bacterium]|nr:holo-ACP synthase [candidate division Zixibacteria bacterium]
MIAGIGIDIIEIERIAKAYRRWGEVFLHKICTAAEARYCLTKRNPAISLAGRFAAKEAGYKALAAAGIEISGWHDLWVEVDRNGRPQLKTVSKTNLIIHLSLSHTKTWAVAMVVTESLDQH